jgi:hypothetical protein
MPRFDKDGELIDYGCDVDNLDNSTDNYPGGNCQFVQDHCDPQSNFNFYTMYYCNFQHHLGKTGGAFAFVPLGVSSLHFSFF